jgi:hypothetical protein
MFKFVVALEKVVEVRNTFTEIEQLLKVGQTEEMAEEVDILF